MHHPPKSISSLNEINKQEQIFMFPADIRGAPNRCGAGGLCPGETGAGPGAYAPERGDGVLTSRKQSSRAHKAFISAVGETLPSG